MSNQINEGAARYTAEKQNQSRPEFSGTQGTQSPQQLVTDHLDLWTSTVTPKSTSGRGSNSKIELTGIKKLRELILELAVRGKLVAQNPEDEPASKLLKKIEAEKAQLIKDGKLKKQKPLAPISDDDEPFELPEGWEWTRFDNLIRPESVISYGVLVPGPDVDDGVPFVRIEDLSLYSPSTLPNKRISVDVDSKYERTRLQGGEILMGVVGSIGKLGIAPVTWKGANIARAVCRIDPTPLISKEYVITILQSQFIQESFSGDTRTLAQPTLNIGLIRTTLTPLPPLAEQQRIAAKVDELMALCDQLEQQSEHQLTAHQQLTDTLLATLTDAADAQELNDNWQRLANHFDLLFSGPMGAWAIDRLKDTILQLAVMGKLVPQNPDDEPASKLLERIEEEKARLVKEGKIKKPKKLPPVSDDEKPFKLPQGWEWVRFGALGQVKGGKRVPKGHSLTSENTGNVYIRVTDMKNYTVKLDDLRYISDEVKNEISQYTINSSDVYITIAGTIGAVGTIPDELNGMNLTENAAKFTSVIVNKNWVVKSLCSTTIQEYFESCTNQQAQPKLALNKIEGAPLALPPLAEQHRIVAKVDELFALCDQLKERLQNASETQLNLTDAIVEQALA